MHPLPRGVRSACWKLSSASSATREAKRISSFSRSFPDTISHTALCGLGQSACKPVQSTLRYFREDYERHVRDKFCPLCNGKPKVLQIDPEKCKGCSLCARNCPVEAITGEIKSPFVIDTEKCIRCNACVKNCKFGAIREECKRYGKGNHVYQRPARRVRRGRKNVLAVIRKAGINMPTLCYYSDLSVYGACRMCVVEDDRGRIDASCSMEPRDGLSIQTNTARLLKYRRMIIELLLASHDRDCTVCEKVQRVRAAAAGAALRCAPRPV